METMRNQTIQIHDEFILREASLHLALEQSGLINPSITQRALLRLGEALIQLGTRLKEHSYRKLTAAEASAPTFLIML